MGIGVFVILGVLILITVVLLSFALGLSSIIYTPSFSLGRILTAIFLFILEFFMIKINISFIKGKNWARIIFLILFGITFLCFFLSLFPLFINFNHNTFLWIVIILSSMIILGISVRYLLSNYSAKEYFKN